MRLAWHSAVWLLAMLMSLAGVRALAQTEEIGLLPRNAKKPVGLTWSAVEEFSPARGELFEVPFAVEEAATVTLRLYSPDGDLIRTLIDAQETVAGDHTASWDGKDDDGITVPDEVYMPVFRAISASGKVVDNPRRYSGGEIVTDFAWTLRGETELSYEMPFPARVLVRAGIEDGPMMRELKHWEPVKSGKAVVRWDGYDKDGVEYFAKRDDMWVVVMAYQLPHFAVITSGNAETDYPTYRARKGWVTPMPNMADIELQRDGVRLEQNYFLPRGYIPEVILDFAEPLEMSRVNLPIAGSTIQFRIDVPDEDRWILDSSFYETGFYIDYEFQSEEEQGFVPLIWSYDASGLEPGRHIATVQLFGFGGFISSDTVEFLVQP